MTSTNDRIHRHWTVTCPLVDDDRTIYFKLNDAIRAKLDGTGAVVGSSGETPGDAKSPILTILDVQGSADMGTVTILGVDRASGQSIFVDLDLAGR